MFISCTYLDVLPSGLQVALVRVNQNGQVRVRKAIVGDEDLLQATERGTFSNCTAPVYAAKVYPRTKSGGTLLPTAVIRFTPNALYTPSNACIGEVSRRPTVRGCALLETQALSIAPLLPHGRPSLYRKPSLNHARPPQDFRLLFYAMLNSVIDRKRARHLKVPFTSHLSSYFMEDTWIPVGRPLLTTNPKHRRRHPCAVHAGPTFIPHTSLMHPRRAALVPASKTGVRKSTKPGAGHIATSRRNCGQPVV